MNASELRIGNYVMVDGIIVKVNSVTRRKIGFCTHPCRERYARIGRVKPVKITPEIARKCEVCLSLDKISGKFGALIGNGFVDTEFLHVLQNIYFFQQHKELVVNL